MVVPYMSQLDWKNPEEYEFLFDLDQTGWAWEFLRRDEEYIEEYRELLESSDSIGVTPPKKEEETGSDYRLRMFKRGQVWKAVGPKDEFCKRWRITNPVSPTNNRPPNFHTYVDEVRSVQDLLSYLAPPTAGEVYESDVELEESSKVLRDMWSLGFVLLDKRRVVKDDSVLVAFDLKADIRGQLRQATALLNKALDSIGANQESLQSSSQKRTENWPLMIRYKDAKAEGASDTQFRKIIYGDDSEMRYLVRDLKKQLKNTPYRECLLKPVDQLPVRRNSQN